jgi:hypothetical protein
MFRRVSLRACLRAPFLVAAFVTTARAAEDVVAVLSADLVPYQQALDAFRDGYKGPVRVTSLAKDGARLQSEARVVLAIGGKAALQKYSESSTLIYCMAPGRFSRPPTAARRRSRCR